MKKQKVCKLLIVLLTASVILFAFNLVMLAVDLHQDTPTEDVSE